MWPPFSKGGGHMPGLWFKTEKIRERIAETPDLNAVMPRPL